MSSPQKPNLKALPRRRLWAGGLALVALVAVGCGSSSSSKAASSPTSAPTSGSSSSVATATTLDLSGVTLKVGVFPAVGWDVELKAASLSNTPYKITYVTQDSGSLQLQSIASHRGPSTWAPRAPSRRSSPVKPPTTATSRSWPRRDRKSVV